MNLFLNDIIEALGKIDNYTNAITYEEFIRDEKTRDAVLRNLEVIGEAAFKLFSAFEIELREFVIEQLKNNYGQEWWKHGVTQDIQKKCRKRQEQDRRNKNHHSELYTYMDFNDLYTLIERERNRDIFQPYFPPDLGRLRTKLSELSEIRNKIMHSTRNINDKEISKMELYIKEIL